MSLIDGIAGGLIPDLPDLPNLPSLPGLGGALGDLINPDLVLRPPSFPGLDGIINPEVPRNPGSPGDILGDVFDIVRR